MSIRSLLTGAARTAAGRLGGALGAFAKAEPIVGGVGRNPISPYKLQQDAAAQRIVESRDALYGRVSTSLGPISSNVSTHPLKGLTPARISSIKEEVLVAGYMTNWACLVEDIFSSDSQIAGLHKSGSEAVTGAPFTVEPAPASSDEEARQARAIADYQQSVIDGIPSWDRAVEELLLGNAGGYQLSEAVYEDKTISFSWEGHSVQVEAPTPTGFNFVHGKHTRWDIGRGDLLELDVGGNFIVPPDHKYITYVASGPFAIRRRGWMNQAAPLAMIKANAWARWSVILDIWGIRAPVGKASQSLYNDPVRRAEMLASLQTYGQGLAALFTDDFDIAPSEGVLDGDSRGMHAALISAINLELAKLILSSILTSEISGTGSYNASDTHADSKQARVLGWERNVSACVREWMRQALKLACFKINEDGSLGDVNPKGLSARLGMTPERVVALCGRPSWRVQREITPKDRMDLYDAGVNKLGLEIDQDSVYREFGFPKARQDGKRLKGEPVIVAGDAATVSTADAQDGEKNTILEDVKSPPPKAKIRRARRTKKDS